MSTHNDSDGVFILCNGCGQRSHKFTDISVLIACAKSQRPRWDLGATADYCPDCERPEEPAPKREQQR